MIAREYVNKESVECAYSGRGKFFGKEPVICRNIFPIVLNG